MYTPIPHSKIRDKLKELVQLCFIKNNDQSRYNYLILGKNKSGIVKRPLWFYHNVLWNWYYQNARVFDWQHICYVWWTCFSRQSTFLWIPTVLLFSTTCFFIRMRHTSYRSFSMKTKRRLPDPLISHSVI